MIEKGQTVLVEIYKNKNTVIETKVTKVGSKYFYLEGEQFKNKKFDINTFQETNNRCFSLYRVYLNHAERNYENTKQDFVKQIKVKLNSSSITLKQLEEINFILFHKKYE